VAGLRSNINVAVGITRIPSSSRATSTSVTEQLRTVQQQIAEFHLLERQLVQVLQRFQTPAPASHTDGCQCLGSDTPEEESRPIPLRGIVKLLGIIVSPGNRRDFPDVIATDPPFRRPALSP
jgi:hypothetical protein